MPLTLEEIKDRLAKRFDEELLVELLNLTSYDLVNRFEDLIENRIDYFEQQVLDTDDDIQAEED